MKIYIVTPTFNSLQWLRACVRSVVDQVGVGVEIHHHVQDGDSSDGTKEWLEQWKHAHDDIPHYTFTYECKPDGGMYDALNKAWEKLPQDADVTSHLNSDEQYLPHVLQRVKEAFDAHPQCEIVHGSFFILNPDGSYHCHRRPVKPHAFTSQTVCEIYTCAAFHRVSTFLKHGIRFDTTYRSIGDLVMYSHILQYGVKTLELPNLFVSTFAMTGHNLAWTEATRVDEKHYATTLSSCVKFSSVFSRLYVNGRRRIVDFFCKSPTEVCIYRNDDTERSVQTIERPTCIWHIPFEWR